MHLRGHFRTTFSFLNINGGGVRIVTLILTTSLDTSSIISQASPPSIVMQSRAATTKQGCGFQSRIGTTFSTFLLCLDSSQAGDMITTS